jgi:HAD superfamily hydrolase (TIGR01509 family)
MKAVIFDLDGTMIDNMMVHHKAWQNKLAEYGIDMTVNEVQRRIHGVNIEILEREFPGRFTVDERIQIAKEKEETYRHIYAPDLELVSGLPALLHELKAANILMGVGSAAPPENVDFVLNTLDLWHYFKAVRHSDDVERGKPDPQVYEILLDELGIDPQECVIFEDTRTGAIAASRAGCKVIVVTTTHQPTEFSDIPEVVKFIQDFTEISVQDIHQL